MSKLRAVNLPPVSIANPFEVLSPTLSDEVQGALDAERAAIAMDETDFDGMDLNHDADHDAGHDSDYEEDEPRNGYRGHSDHHNGGRGGYGGHGGYRGNNYRGNNYRRNNYRSNDQGRAFQERSFQERGNSRSEHSPREYVKPTFATTPLYVIKTSDKVGVIYDAIKTFIEEKIPELRNKTNISKPFGVLIPRSRPDGSTYLAETEMTIIMMSREAEKALEPFDFPYRQNIPDRYRYNAHDRIPEALLKKEKEMLEEAEGNDFSIEKIRKLMIRIPIIEQTAEKTEGDDLEVDSSISTDQKQDQEKQHQANQHQAKQYQAKQYQAKQHRFRGLMPVEQMRKALQNFIDMLTSLEIIKPEQIEIKIPQDRSTGSPKSMAELNFIDIDDNVFIEIKVLMHGYFYNGEPEFFTSSGEVLPNLRFVVNFWDPEYYKVHSNRRGSEEDEDGFRHARGGYTKSVSSRDGYPSRDRESSSRDSAARDVFDGGAFGISFDSRRSVPSRAAASRETIHSRDVASRDFPSRDASLHNIPKPSQNEFKPSSWTPALNKRPELTPEERAAKAEKEALETLERLRKEKASGKQMTNYSKNLLAELEERFRIKTPEEIKEDEEFEAKTAGWTNLEKTKRREQMTRDRAAKVGAAKADAAKVGAAKADEEKKEVTAEVAPSAQEVSAALGSSAIVAAQEKKTQNYRPPHQAQQQAQQQHQAQPYQQNSRGSRGGRGQNYRGSRGGNSGRGQLHQLHQHQQHPRQQHQQHQPSFRDELDYDEFMNAMMSINPYSDGDSDEEDVTETVSTPVAISTVSLSAKAVSAASASALPSALIEMAFDSVYMTAFAIADDATREQLKQFREMSTKSAANAEKAFNAVYMTAFAKADPATREQLEKWNNLVKK